MSDMSVADALLHAPASTSKTDLDTAIDAVVTELDDANTAGHLSDEGLVQCKAELIDWVENLASNLNG